MRMLYLICACAALTVLGTAGMAQEAPEAPRTKSVEGEFKPEMHRGGKAHPRHKGKAGMEAETFSAKVMEVKEHKRGEATFLSLTVEVDGTKANLMLGPAEYVKEKGAAYTEGDTITVKGFKREAPDGAMRIRAREIEKDGLVYAPFGKGPGMRKGRMGHPPHMRGGMGPGCGCPCGSPEK